jgi:CubicO group peptidase (beta-lactamase class C family)
VQRSTVAKLQPCIQEERQGLREESEMEGFDKVRFTSGLSRRSFLRAGAMAIGATGLVSAGNVSKGDGTLKKASVLDEMGKRAEATSTAGLSKARLGRMHGVMAGHVDRGAVPGLVALVSRHGEVHVDAMGMKAVGGSDLMRRDTLFRIASMTKPVTAAAAMILVEECKLRLDEPVDRWLPELADRKVLKQIDSPLDDTVPAKRPITLRDLLTFRLGYGAVMVFPSRYPIQKAMEEAGIAPSANIPLHPPDELMKRFGSLPLLHQPGEKWMYHSGSDILGVLIARATGQKLEGFFRERISGPLGMKDTGFSVPEAKRDQLATCYQTDPTTGRLVVFDDARGPVCPSSRLRVRRQRAGLDGR